MVIKHSLNILASRFSLVYKTIIFVIIITLLFTALAVSALYPTLKPIYSEIVKLDFGEHLANAFKSTFSGDIDFQTEAYNQIRLDYEYIKEIFANNTLHVWLAVLWIVLLLILYKFLTTLSHYTITDITNHFMSSNSRFGFTSNFIANFKRSLPYSCVETLITLPYYALMALLIWGVIELALMFSLFIGLVMTLFILVFGVAFKRAVLACWLPNMINKKQGTFKSLKESLKENKKIIGFNLGLYFIYNLLFTTFTILFALTTLGIGFFVAQGIGIVLVLIIDNVIYYRKNKMRYYASPDQVVTYKIINEDMN